jgi:FKBP-type peptidyl-prolyl cis-trans isomerase FkpA
MARVRFLLCHGLWVWLCLCLSCQRPEPGASRLQLSDRVVGSGAEALPGRTVVMHYRGRLADGRVFDSSQDRPVEFVLGQKMVIPGWEQGVRGMRVGGKRTLVVPAHLGYGAAGHGTAVPPHATLVFEVELVQVR